MAKIKSLFRASATSFTANNGEWSKPSAPMLITHWGEWDNGTIWVRCTDGNIRKCKTDRIGNAAEVAQLVAALEYAYENKLPVILRAMGSYNSTTKWFAEVTYVAYGEIASACPLKATATTFA